MSRPIAGQRKSAEPRPSRPLPVGGPCSHRRWAWATGGGRKADEHGRPAAYSLDEGAAEGDVADRYIQQRLGRAARTSVLRAERPTGVRPAVRVCEHLVEVVDERQEPGSKVVQ